MKYSPTILMALFFGLLASEARAQSQEGWWSWALPAVRAEDERISRPRAERSDDGWEEEGRRTRTTQSRRDDRYEETRGRREDERRRRPGDYGDYERGRTARKAQGKAPAFCASGEGHPVHGRRWCVEKGFGLGGARYDPRWEERRWEDVIFRRPAAYDDRNGFEERTLGRILGDVILDRVESHGRRIGLDAPLVGRWSPASRGSRVLQIRSGDRPLAELTDSNGDGRVDAVLLARNR